MKIHNTLYMPRKCMGGEDEDVFLFICWNNLIHYISKTLSKVDSGMAFSFFFRCCHGEHRERCKYCPYYVDINEETK